MDKFCNKCKKVFGATEPWATIHGKDYCVNCCKCDKCQQPVKGQCFEKDDKLYCQKCKSDLENENDKDKCSFCGKKASQYYHKQGKPETKSCYDCRSELWKPAGYDPNAKVTCRCGKQSTPKWVWNGNSWDTTITMSDADCCRGKQDEYDQCKCGADKNKKELSCSKCIEREKEQNWKVFRVFEPLRQSPT